MGVEAVGSSDLEAVSVPQVRPRMSPLIKSAVKTLRGMIGWVLVVDGRGE